MSDPVADFLNSAPRYARPRSESDADEAARLGISVEEARAARLAHDHFVRDLLGTKSSGHYKDPRHLADRSSGPLVDDPWVKPVAPPRVRGTYRPEEDPWRHHRCPPPCVHRCSEHVGPEVACRWCRCEGYAGPCDCAWVDAPSHLVPSSPEDAAGTSKGATQT